jgi:hypothetical protein
MKQHLGKCASSVRHARLHACLWHHARLVLRDVGMFVQVFCLKPGGSQGGISRHVGETAGGVWRHAIGAGIMAPGWRKWLLAISTTRWRRKMI